MGTEQETKERESSRTSLHPGRANSGNLPVALHSKRQPISPSVATPSWLRPCRNEGVELEKRQRKLQLNIGVHSNSNAAGRRSGANAFGPSGAVSASAGNCGHARRGDRANSVFSHALSQWHLPGWVVPPLHFSGTSQDRIVSSPAPFGGEIGEQQR